MYIKTEEAKRLIIIEQGFAHDNPIIEYLTKIIEGEESPREEVDINKLEDIFNEAAFLLSDISRCIRVYMKDNKVTQQQQTMKMYIITSANGYDYYEGVDENNKKFYCLVPANQPAPSGGYYSHEYACKIKDVPDLFNPDKSIDVK